MKDPVCGMDVDEANATKVEHNGQTFYFCNDECAQKFKQSPDRYMQGQGQRQQGQQRPGQQQGGGRAVGS